MNQSLTKAHTYFADNLMPKHKKEAGWTYNLSAGLAHLSKGLLDLDAKLDVLLKSQQPPK